MGAFFARRPRAQRGRSSCAAFALGIWAAAFALGVRAQAQSLDSQSSRPLPHQDNPRRARTMRPERNDLAREQKRDYADGALLAEGQGDVAFIEARIRDLSAKVRELNELLQKEREAAEPVRYAPQPMRATLLEEHQPPRFPKTYSEALELAVRDHARAISAAFNDPEQRQHLAIDPEPAEIERLLEPIYAGFAVAGSPVEITHAHLQALVYATFLEARIKIDPREPLPVAHKMLLDLHADRAGLAAHLHHGFLLDNPVIGRDLRVVLAAIATRYPEPSGMRDFLRWLAGGVGADLKEELLRKAAYPYRADAGGQFAAAAENATRDNGDVLRLQVELQRMLVEAKALRAARFADETTAGAWEHRLLQAERELDRLVRASDSEREAVMTLARRVPIEEKPTTPIQPAMESLRIEPAQRVASDDLTTQH